MSNAAANAFAASFESELIFGQVLIQKVQNGYHIRHIADAECDPEKLESMDCSQLRALARDAKTGQFRALRAAPTLQAGWLSAPKSESELKASLDALYPLAVEEWALHQQGKFTGLTFEEFSSRQTGMYRITQLLKAPLSGATIHACCAKELCLKQRVWTAEGVEADAPETKSLIPCLEPCPVFMEFARKSIKLEQQANVSLSLHEDERALLLSLIQEHRQKSKASNETERLADFSSPSNERRLNLLEARLRMAT